MTIVNLQHIFRHEIPRFRQVVMIDQEIPMINYVGHERNWKLHVRHMNESLLLDMYLLEIRLEATTFVLNIYWIWKILW